MAEERQGGEWPFRELLNKIGKALDLDSSTSVYKWTCSSMIHVHVYMYV